MVLLLEAHRALVDVHALDAIDLIAELALARTVHTQRVLGAVKVAPTANVDGRPLAAHLWGAARQVLVRTGALVAAVEVVALGGGTAGVGAGALVDVETFDVGVACVAALARALVGAEGVETLTVKATRVLPKTLVFVCGGCYSCVGEVWTGKFMSVCVDLFPKVHIRTVKAATPLNS